MPTHRLQGFVAGSALLLVTSLSHAQCAKDTECKGDRVCEAGKCVTAPAAAPAAPAQYDAVPAAPVTTSAPATSAGKEPPPDAPAKPRMQRHSTGMMVGGIVMVSLAPVALVVAGVARLGKGICDIDDERGCDDDYDPTIYGSLLTGVVLLGVGIPLLVIGAKKEPVEENVAQATITPWLTPNAAGVGLRIDM
jgi:hypothetical protein